MINWLIIIFTDWLMVIYHFRFQRLNKSKNTYNDQQAYYNFYWLAYGNISFPFSTFK